VLRRVFGREVAVTIALAQIDGDTLGSNRA
jgi:hypothetical protein